MNDKRRICVVTGNRAEYGLLYWLLREIQQQPALALQVVITGAHLSPEFGLTGRDVEDAGFPVAARVEMLLSSDTPVGMGKSLGVGVMGFADTLARLRPHLLVVLGDRVELLAAATTAMIHAIPIAHIHGGESSEGVMDDMVRHALTKLSHLHFVAAEPYRQRVIRMGEHPARVFNTGAPGLDHLTRTPLLDRPAWEQQTGFPLGGCNILLTHHPVGEEGLGEIDAVLAALDHFPLARVVITGSNADAGGRAINQRLADFAARQPQRAGFFTNLGTVRYLSLLQLVDVVVGNSSSGIIEAPALATPTVNVGPRQKGRLRAPSILDTIPEEEAITAAIRQALTPAFQQRAARKETPYGQGDACRKMAAILRDTPLTGLFEKSFHHGEM